MGQDKGTEPPAVPGAGNLGKFLPEKGKSFGRGCLGSFGVPEEPPQVATRQGSDTRGAPHPNPRIFGVLPTPPPQPDSSRSTWSRCSSSTRACGGCGCTRPSTPCCRPCCSSRQVSHPRGTRGHPCVPKALLMSPQTPSPDHAGIAQRDVIDRFQEKVALTLKSYIDHQHPPGEGR